MIVLAKTNKHTQLMVIRINLCTRHYKDKLVLIMRRYCGLSFKTFYKLVDDYNLYLAFTNVYELTNLEKPLHLNT